MYIISGWYTKTNRHTTPCFLSTPLLRLERQAAGMSLNMRQHAAINAALLKAKREQNDMVRMEDEHTASVQSRSDEQV